MNRLTLAALMLGCMTAVMADDTTRRGLRVSREAVAVPQPPAMPVADTVAVIPGQVRISGYDKPLRSTGESFFVTNSTGTPMTSLEVRIDYRDMQGRQLHSRQLFVEADIPAGETRRVDIRSWDRHQTFYYHLGPRPSRGVATPYDVTVTPLRMIYTP